MTRLIINEVRELSGQYQQGTIFAIRIEHQEKPTKVLQLNE